MIMEAIMKEIKKEKYLGPNGLSMEFYNRTWDVGCG
jgi:hypothetical protein